MRKGLFFYSILLLILIFSRCKPDPGPDPFMCEGSNPTPYILELPNGITAFTDAVDNPMTEEGVELGRRLFYDAILSKDSSLACAGCHQQKHAFTVPEQFSLGVEGVPGNRNSMPLFNLGWNPNFTWDGRAPTIEEQALEPVPNPVEMHLEWPEAVQRLQGHSQYPEWFCSAFGTTDIHPDLATRAIAQFLRSITSFDSEYDKDVRGEGQMSQEALDGFDIFVDEGFGLGNPGHCFHCHGAFPHFSDYAFHNNGLDMVTDFTQWPDPGRGGITNEIQDYGHFKTPSLRNVALTGPYMHDGRMQSLEEVIEHYNSGFQTTGQPYDEPLAVSDFSAGLNLTDTEKSNLIAFMNALTDSTLITNPDYSDPW